MADEKDLVKSEGGKLAKRSLFAGKKVGLAAKLEENKVSFDPHKMEHRIGLIADDSGSMGGKKIQDARTAVGEFLHFCSPQNTSVALYGFHQQRRWKLSVDLVTLDVLKNSLEADQSTPLFDTMEVLLSDNPDLTRAVVFSDGEATDGSLKDPEGVHRATSYWGSSQTYRDDVVEKYVAAGIKVDTVFITDNAEAPDNWTLQEIAKRTGGLYLRFKDSGTFAKAFKYLAPAFRGYLADPNFKKQIGAE